MNSPRGVSITLARPYLPRIYHASRYLAGISRGIHTQRAVHAICRYAAVCRAFSFAHTAQHNRHYRQGIVIMYRIPKVTILIFGVDTLSSLGQSAWLTVVAGTTVWRHPLSLSTGQPQTSARLFDRSQLSYVISCRHPGADLVIMPRISPRTSARSHCSSRPGRSTPLRT